MPDLRILGVTDTHLTDSMGLGGQRPTTEDGSSLVLEQHRRFWRWFADLALRRQVSAVLHAGDVYETCRPSPAAEAVFAEAMLSITEVCPFAVMPGNHDKPVGGGTHALEPLRNVRPGRFVVLDSASPVRLAGQQGTSQLVWRPGNSGPATKLTVFPLPYPDRVYLSQEAQTPEHANGLIGAALQTVLDAHARVAALSPNPTAILFHGTLAGAEFDSYQIAPASDIQVQVGGAWHAFTVQLAGHIHRRQRAPGTDLPGYIGAPDRHDFGEEGYVPGVALFTVHEDGRVEEEHIPYPGARRFHTLAVAADLEEAEDGVVLFPTRDGLTDERLLADEGVYRLKGKVTPLGKQRAQRLVRQLRGNGWIVSDATEVQYENRARVVVARGADRNTALGAVFASRPRLAANSVRILARVEEVVAACAKESAA